MYHVLTEEEAINSSKGDMKLSDEWWSNLSLKEKKSIYDYHKDMFKRIRCTHEFNKINFYSTIIEDQKRVEMRRYLTLLEILLKKKNE